MTLRRPPRHLPPLFGCALCSQGSGSQDKCERACLLGCDLPRTAIRPRTSGATRTPLALSPVRSLVGL